jgi:starch-binding outer membrane protein, SusD/RagB family
MKSIYSIFFLLGILTLDSCSLLDQVSPNDLQVSTAINNGGQAKAALYGIYSSMQDKYYYGGHYLLFTEALSTNASTGGYNFISLDEAGSQNVSADNEFVTQTWLSIYKTIANTNNLLAALGNIKDPTFSETEKNDIEGQARAIRAMAHFDLLRYYGEHWNLSSTNGIPIVNSIQGIADVKPKSTVAQVYQFVTDELVIATGQLDKSATAVQYINYNGARSLLARVYLYKNDKLNAANYATQVINSRAYNLLPAANYLDIFNKRKTSESILELSFNSQNRSSYNELTYNRDEAPRAELYYLANQPLQTFFNTRTSDVRLSTIDFGTSSNDVTVTPDGRSQKYRGENAKDNSAYVIRYAELYLIAAESKGRVNGGLTFLNNLRTARGMTALTAASVSTDEKYMNALLDECNAEFNFEGHRYFDLARTGTYTAATNAAAFRAILPIPNREIRATKGVLTQNPGY